MKTALVTGSSGFVGSHFVRRLVAEGYLVTQQDITRGSDSRDFFRSDDATSFALVVHCAAIVGGRKTIDGAPLALASNLELDAGLFQWALRSRPGHILYFSSSAAYPVPFQSLICPTRLEEDMIDETLSRGFLAAPDQLYGWAKLTGENLAYRARQEGLSVSVVRPFSGYGDDQALSYPFPKFVDRAATRKDPFEIWGDGRQVRDFIHIDDIVDACMRMVDFRLLGPVNLGWGRPTSMRELADLVCAEAGYSPRQEFLPAEPSGVEYRVCSAARLQEFYFPQVDLEEGIRKALRAWSL